MTICNCDFCFPTLSAERTASCKNSCCCKPESQENTFSLFFSLPDELCMHILFLLKNDIMNKKTNNVYCSKINLEKKKIQWVRQLRAFLMVTKEGVSIMDGLISEQIFRKHDVQTNHLFDQDTRCKQCYAENIFFDSPYCFPCLNRETKEQKEEQWYFECPVLDLFYGTKELTDSLC